MENEKDKILSFSFISLLLILLSSSWSLQGIRNGGCSQYITAPLCFSFLLTLFPSFSVVSPWAAVLQEKNICSIVNSHTCYRSCQEKLCSSSCSWLAVLSPVSWSTFSFLGSDHRVPSATPAANIFPFTPIRTVRVI